MAAIMRSPAAAGRGGPPPQATPPGKSQDSSAEKVDALVERAQQAMQDRHYIDPARGQGALALYRDALVVDPNNGEKRARALQRLAEILITRVAGGVWTSAKFDVALQSLETGAQHQCR